MRLRLEHWNGGVNIIMLTRFRERVRLLYTANECAKYTINGQSANAATIVEWSLPVLFCSVLLLTTRQQFRVIRAEQSTVETRDNFPFTKERVCWTNWVQVIRVFHCLGSDGIMGRLVTILGGQNDHQNLIAIHWWNSWITIVELKILSPSWWWSSPLQYTAAHRSLEWDLNEARWNEMTWYNSIVRPHL